MLFPDESIDIIYYDPPHVIRRASDTKWMEFFKFYRRKHESKTSPGFFDRYGSWPSKDAFLRNIEGVNREFYRVLKPNGVLHVKLGVEWSKRTRCITIDDFLSRTTNFELVRDRVTLSKSNLGKNKVHWMTMRPKKAVLPAPTEPSSGCTHAQEA